MECETDRSIDRFEERCDFISSSLKGKPNPIHRAKQNKTNKRGKDDAHDDEQDDGGCDDAANEREDDDACERANARGEAGAGEPVV